MILHDFSYFFIEFDSKVKLKFKITSYIVGIKIINPNRILIYHVNHFIHLQKNVAIY